MPDTNIPATGPCPHCGRYNNRAIAIDAVIIKDDKILLIKRNSDPFKGYWALPGGHIEWNEEVTQTLRREVLEETGLTVTDYKIFDVYSKPQRDPKQKITIAYSVQTDGEPVVGSDASEFKWFTLSALPDLAFDHHEIIADYLKKTAIL